MNDTKTNRQWILASRPRGMPTHDNFKLVENAVPEPAEGQALVQTLYLSVDPYMRGRMRNVRSYVPPLAVGEVIEGGVVGRVVASRSCALKVGDFVNARLGWQDYAVAEASSLRKLPPDPALLSAALGVLGVTGMTAYFALLDIGRPKPGETVVVSGAAGAVGSLVGQIAKINGCRAVGIAGSDEKVRLLRDEFGFDAGINYKTAGNMRKALREVCPDGINIYFDNVGGEISDAAISLIAMKARIIICGQITLYNHEEAQTGPRNLQYLLVNRARMEGFLVHDYLDRYPEGIAQMSAWLKEGKIRHRETIIDGLENAPTAFLGLFHGKNIGKQLVRVAHL
jgi:NADPH-dependent curcumin reductase CurA